MKFCAFLAFVLLFALLLGTAAYADVAYEPDDNFYERHWDECKYENRIYITNGAEGCTVVYSSPTGSAAAVIPNGSSFYVSYTWDGDWGCIEYDPDTLQAAYGESSGWVLMADMCPEYDSTSFRQEHADRISSESFTLMLPAGAEYIGYKYPGSGLVSTTLGSFSGDDYTTIYVDSVYTDADGGRWGYVGYFFGHRDFWINLDNPDIQLGPGPEFREPELIPAADEETMQAVLGSASPFSPYIIAGAVGAALIALAICAFILLKKKKSA